MHDVVRVCSEGIAFVTPQTVSAPTVSESPPASHASDPQTQRRAKQYSKTKIIVSLVETILLFSVTVAAMVLGLTSLAESVALSLSSNPYGAFLIFAGFLAVSEMIIGFPFSYYSGFYLEHKFKLSNTTFQKWVWEGTKGILVGIPIAMPVILVFYYCLRSFGSFWWLPVGSVLFLFSVILARLAPILIFPLFYKFKPIEDSSVKTRILDLCSRVGVKVEGIFVFDMSKNTKKANAAFTGIGKSKRIILGDTLVANFTDDEIESVFAHELGHYKLRHIWLMMLVGTMNSFLGLYLTAQLYDLSLPWFGFARVDQLAALPLLTIWLGIYSLVTAPLNNMLSRANERAADRYAIRVTQNKEAFINAMRKLAKINLADVAPHPLVEFFFYSHPSIDKRIQATAQGVA